MMKVLLHVLLLICHQQEFYHNAYFESTFLETILEWKPLQVNFLKQKKYLLHLKYKFPEIQWRKNNLWNKSLVALVLIS